MPNARDLKCLVTSIVDEKPRALFSRFLREGTVSFFFDVYTKGEEQYAIVTRSEKGQDGLWVRSRIRIEADAMRDFAKCVNEMSKQIKGN
jgi:predicted Ser/Thr protein kinase